MGRRSEEQRSKSEDHYDGGARSVVTEEYIGMKMVVVIVHWNEERWDGERGAVGRKSEEHWEGGARSGGTKERGGLNKHLLADTNFALHSLPYFFYSTSAEWVTRKVAWTLLIGTFQLQVYPNQYLSHGYRNPTVCHSFVFFLPALQPVSLPMSAVTGGGKRPRSEEEGRAWRKCQFLWGERGTAERGAAGRWR